MPQTIKLKETTISLLEKRRRYQRETWDEIINGLIKEVEGKNETIC
jgi:hypothetical protein